MRYYIPIMNMAPRTAHGSLSANNQPPVLCRWKYPFLFPLTPTSFNCFGAGLPIVPMSYLSAISPGRPSDDKGGVHRPVERAHSENRPVNSPYFPKNRLYPFPNLPCACLPCQRHRQARRQVGIGQYKMIDQVIKWLSLDRYPQFAHPCKIGLTLFSG